MKRVYISLYNKNNLEYICEKFIKAGWEILSSYSTWKYISSKGIPTTKIETELHPNLAVIQSLTSKNIYKIPKINLIIADLPQDLKDEVYNLILIVFALRKKIPVIISLENTDFIEKIEILGDITESMKRELEIYALNHISFILAEESYLKFPYINEKLNHITIPLKKINELNYGENPHQKSYLYQTLLKGIEFEILIGQINTNHLFDIKKSIDLMNEIETIFIMSLNHSNISDFLWGNKIKDPQAINNNTYCIAYNSIIDYNLFQIIISKGAKLIISRGFDEDSIKLARDVSKKDSLILVKINSHIRPPKEFDIFFFDKYLVVQDKNFYQPSFDINKEKKLSNEEIEKIKIGYSIVKNLKTFSSAIIANNQIVAINQGETSSYNSLKNLFLKLTDIKNDTKIIKNLGKFTIVMDGVFSKEMIKIIENCPIDFIASSSIDDKETLKELEKKSIIFVKFDKRTYKHF